MHSIIRNARAGFRESNGAPPAPGAGRSSVSGGATAPVEWLPYSSKREKLESWAQYGSTNDVGDGRNLMKQFSKNERT